MNCVASVPWHAKSKCQNLKVGFGWVFQHCSKLQVAKSAERCDIHIRLVPARDGCGEISELCGEDGGVVSAQHRVDVRFDACDPSGVFFEA